MTNNSLSELLVPFSLSGKVALVTGASSGLGYHFSVVLAQAGARVVLGARRKDRLEEVREAIVDSGGDAAAVELDVTDADSVSQCFNKAEEAFGCVDIVVNNAGISRASPFIDMPLEEWDTVLDTNLRGVMLVSREASKRMRNHEKAGSIINISSILSERTYTYLSHYCVAKSAVVQLTKSSALELASNNIRVNAICPGFFATEMIGDYLDSEEGQAMMSAVPQQRFGELEDLNGPLLLFASEAGKFLTGAVLTADGGHSIAGIQ